MTYDAERIRKLDAAAIAQCSPVHIENVIKDLIETALAKEYPAVQLMRRHTGECEVSLEIGGKWITVIKEYGDIISHIVEPLGIKSAIEKS